MTYFLRKTTFFLGKTTIFPRKTSLFPRKTSLFPRKTSFFPRKMYLFLRKRCNFLEIQDNFYIITCMWPKSYLSYQMTTLLLSDHFFHFRIFTYLHQTSNFSTLFETRSVGQLSISHLLMHLFAPCFGIRDPWPTCFSYLKWNLE